MKNISKTSALVISLFAFCRTTHAADIPIYQLHKDLSSLSMFDLTGSPFIDVKYLFGTQWWVGDALRQLQPDYVEALAPEPVRNTLENLVRSALPTSDQDLQHREVRLLSSIVSQGGKDYAHRATAWGVSIDPSFARQWFGQLEPPHRKVAELLRLPLAVRQAEQWYERILISFVFPRITSDEKLSEPVERRQPMRSLRQFAWRAVLNAGQKDDFFIPGMISVATQLSRGDLCEGENERSWYEGGHGTRSTFTPLNNAATEFSLHQLTYTERVSYGVVRQVEIPNFSVAESN